MSVAADVLRQLGLVPVVPDVSRYAETAQRKAAGRVPAVPAVPARNTERIARPLPASARPREIATVKSLPAPAELRARLADAADREGVARSLLERLPDAELEGVDLLSDAGLATYARMIEADADRMRGHVPKGWNQPSTCRRCGPVLLWPSAPADVLGCPWCVPRSRGVSLPRPANTCATCMHRLADTVNPEGGHGSCAQGRDHWPPHQRHPCEGWTP